MIELVNAFAVAVVLTAIFEFRFRFWGSGSGILASYFALFFAAEWLTAHYFFPPGAMGLEVAAMCVAVTVPVVVGIVLARRYERRQGTSE